MEQIFITNLGIEKVRHLKGISIPLSEERMKPLILTGKNGSGKTSVVEALAVHLNNAFTDKCFVIRDELLSRKRGEKENAIQEEAVEAEILRLEKEICEYEEKLRQSRQGLKVQFNTEAGNIYALKEKYHYILAYYRANRIFSAKQPNHVEKVQFKDDYGMGEFPREEFVKYLLDLKMTEALARNNGRDEKADEIRKWFKSLQQLLREIFDDASVELVFDEDTFEFHIHQQGKEPFDFNTLSSGYQAVLDIVLDIIMRMQKQTQRSFDFKIPGIVLIDEIETHLHLELQRHIMPLLIGIFPNIQFIVTSHSPFILSSLDNAVIYDLENNVLVEDGLDNVPYQGIVEGYFKADEQSEFLKKKFGRYKELVTKKVLSEDDLDEIAELELYLDDIPDYLAINISTEYQRMKVEFMGREDIDG